MGRRNSKIDTTVFKILEHQYHSIPKLFYSLDLEKTTPYTFILCGKTRIGCGEPSINRLLTMEKRGKK
jgi:hypothetical protein